MKFVGKTVIVTGGGSGIGRAASLGFAEQGARVAVVDLNGEAGANTVGRIRDLGGTAVAIETDVSNEEQVIRMIGQVIEFCGSIDVLVNNAGMIMPKTIEETTYGEWERILRINAGSVFLCSKYAMEQLKRNKGKIVNMASLNGLIGQKGNTAYASAKGAVIALTKSMAVDYAPFGVRINCICPAGVHTPLLERWFASMDDPAKGRSDQERSHLLGYIATPEEIAGTILFLASDDSAFLTGQAIQVEGGASLGYGAGPKAEWNSTSL